MFRNVEVLTWKKVSSSKSESSDTKPPPIIAFNVMKTKGMYRNFVQKPVYLDEELEIFLRVLKT